MSAESFIAAIKKHGMAKTNRFRVEIPLPGEVENLIKKKAGYSSDQPSDFAKATQVLKDMVLGRNSNYQRGLDLMCETTQLPGQSFLTTERRTNTSNIKLPYDTQYDDITFVFYVSSDMYEKAIIETWMEYIYNRKTHSFSYYDDYVADLIVRQVGEAGQDTHSIKMINAYPMQVNALDLSQGQQDIHRLSVTFTYHNWKEDDGRDDDSILKDKKASSSLFEKVTNPKVLNKVYDIAMGNNPGFTGEALFVYNKISDLTKKYANISAGELSNIVSTIQNDLGSNNNITNEDRLSLSNIIDDLKDKLK